VDAAERNALARRILNTAAWGLMALGLGVTCLTFVVPVVRLLSAYSWGSADCSIVRSSFHQEMTSVRTRRGGRDVDETRPEYIPDITFAYTVDGRAYQATRYDFSSAHGYMRSDDAKALVSRYPPGAHVTCYVNPRDPSQAVLVRGATRSLALGLMPMAFFAFGLFLKVRTDKVFPPGSSSERVRPREP
jgi:uncharacterized protein DUF3592